MTSDRDYKIYEGNEDINAPHDDTSEDEEDEEDEGGIQTFDFAYLMRLMIVNNLQNKRQTKLTKTLLDTINFFFDNFQLSDLNNNDNGEDFDHDAAIMADLCIFLKQMREKYT